MKPCFQQPLGISAASVPAKYQRVRCQRPEGHEGLHRYKCGGYEANWGLDGDGGYQASAIGDIPERPKEVTGVDITVAKKI